MQWALLCMWNLLLHSRVVTSTQAILGEMPVAMLSVFYLGSDQCVQPLCPHDTWK